MATSIQDIATARTVLSADTKAHDEALVQSRARVLEYNATIVQLQSGATTLESALSRLTGSFGSAFQGVAAPMQAINTQLQTTYQQAQAVAQVEPWKNMQATAQAQTALENMGSRVDKLLAQVTDMTKTNFALKLDANVDSVKTQLTYLQDQLKELATKPATVEVKAEISQARAQLAAVTRDFQTIQRENAVITPKVNSAEAVAQLDLLKGAVMGVNSQVGMLVAGGGLLIAGQMATEAFKESAGAAIEWNTKLNEVQGNTTLTDQQMGQLKSTIHDMVASTNADMNSLADGLVHAENLGYGVADSQAIADAAFKSSASTGAQLGDTINAVSSVLKEYNGRAQDAATYTDLLHNAAAQGNMTMEQFVDAGGKTIATAAALGFKLDDVSAAYAALTRHGEDAAMAGTQLTGILSHIVAPTSAAKSEIESLSKATGVDLVGDFEKAQHGGITLNALFADIQKATAGDSAEIFRLIPALRGGQGALVLAGTGAQDFNDILKSQADIINGKSTPTLDAFQRTTHTTGYELGQAANQAKLFSLAVGDTLVKAVSDATTSIGTFLSTLDLTKSAAASHAQELGVEATATKTAGEVLLEYNQHLLATGQGYEAIRAETGDAINVWERAQEAAHNAAIALQEQGDAAQVAAQQTQLQASLGSVYMQNAAALDTNTAAQQANTQAMYALGSAYQHGGQQIGQGTATASMGLLQMSDDAAKAADKVASALDKMAKDTDASAKDGAKGISDLYNLIRNMPDGLSPSMDKIRQQMTTALADIQHNGGISAKGLHDEVVGWAQQMAQDSDLEVQSMGKAILDDMATTAANAKGPGINTGINWIDGLMSGISSGQPAVDQYVSSLLKEFDLKDAFAILGDNAAKAFGNKLAFGTANFIRSIGDSLVAGLGGPNSPVGKMLSGQFDAAANRIIGIYGNMSHQFQGFAGVVDYAAPKIADHHKKVGESATDMGKKTALAFEDIVRAVGSAAQDTEGPSASMAKGLSDILTVAREKVPADAKWIQAAVNDLIKSYQAGTLTADQENAKMRAILEKLTHDPNVDLSLLAQSQLDNLQKVETQAAASAQKTADKLSAEYEKASQSVIQSFGKIAEDSQKKNATVSDGWIALLDTLKTATDAKMPEIPQKINDELAKIESGKESLQGLHDFSIAVLEDMRDKGDLIMKQWAAAQLADIQASDAANAAAAQKAADDLAKAAASARNKVLDSFTSLVDDASKPGASLGGLMQKELDLMQAATDAKMPQVTATLQGWFDKQARGSEVSTADMVAYVTSLYKQLVANGDREGAALAQVWLEHQAQIADAAQKTAQEQQRAAEAAAQASMQAAQSLSTGLEKVGAALLDGKTSMLQVLNDLGPLMKAAADTGMSGVADAIQRYLQEAANGGGVQAQALYDNVMHWLTLLAQSGNAQIALFAQQEIAQLQAAAAAAQYNAAIAQQQALIQQDQVVQKQLQDAVKAASAAVQGEQQVVSDLNTKLQAATKSLNDWKNAQLEGTDATNKALSANKQAGGVIQLAIDDLKAAGGNASTAIQTLQQQWQKVQQEHQEAQASLMQQMASTTNAQQKAALQQSLDQLKAVDTQAGQSYQQALGALQGGGGDQALQALLQQLQTQGSQISQLGSLTFDPLKDAIKNATDATKEFSFDSIIKGAGGAQSEIAKLTPELAGATKQLDALKLSQQQAQAAAQAWADKMAVDQAQLQTLQQAQQAAAQGAQATATAVQTLNSAFAGTSQAVAPVVPAVQGMVGGVGATLDAQMDVTNKDTIWGKWWGPKGLLGVMLARLGNTGDSGVQGGGFSFIPNVIAAMRGLLQDQLPGIMTDNLPSIEQAWTTSFNNMKQAVHDAADAIVQDAQRAIAAWQNVPGGGGSNTQQTQQSTGLPHYATGGIAWTPQVAHIAEDEPEAVIPLSKINVNGAVGGLGAGAQPTYQNCVFLNGQVVVQDRPDIIAILKGMAETQGLLNGGATA